MGAVVLAAAFFVRRIFNPMMADDLRFRVRTGIGWGGRDRTCESRDQNP